MWYFCLFAISFPVCCEEMFLILQGPVPVLPGLWISSCSAFLVELTVPSFLLPRTSLLFYHSTDTVFPLDSVSFCLPCPAETSLGRVYTWLTLGLPQPVLRALQVTPWVGLSGWLLKVFFSICTLRRTCLWCQHRRAVGNHGSLVPPCAPCCCYGKLGCGHWGSSHVCPLRSKTAALTDDRIRTMSEVITGIRTVKMNAWEKSFIDLITRLRR